MTTNPCVCGSGAPSREECDVCSGRAMQWAQEAARARAARPMREHGLLVILQVPADWTADEVERSLAQCVSFGSPRVQTIYDVPAPEPRTPPETVVSVRPDAGL